MRSALRTLTTGRSPGTERVDRVRKGGVYARFGVTHSWILDRAVRQMADYVLHGDGDRVRGLAGYDEPFRADAIRGFEFTQSVVPRPGGA